jgi:superfamily II DNA or RNA helicase
MSKKVRKLNRFDRAVEALNNQQGGRGTRSTKGKIYEKVKEMLIEEAVLDNDNVAESRRDQALAELADLDVIKQFEAREAELSAASNAPAAVQQGKRSGIRISLSAAI